MANRLPSALEKGSDDCVRSQVEEMSSLTLEQNLRNGEIFCNLVWSCVYDGKPLPSALKMVLIQCICFWRIFELLH